MFSNIKAFIKNNIYTILPAFVFTTIFVTVNFCIPHIWDDIYFSTLFNDVPGGLNLTNINNFLVVSRFYNWSGRLPIDFLCILFSRVPNLFRIFNVAVGTSIIVLIFKILRSKSIIVNFLIVFVCCTVDATLIAGAGLVSTSLNYLWPTLCFLITIYCSSIYIIDKKRPNIALLLVSCLSLILYGVWLETIAVALTITFAALFIYWIIVYKKANWYFIFVFILSFGMSIYALVVPGNRNRYILEIHNWYEAYANFNFFDKISLGLIASYRDYINPISFFLFILIIVSVFINNNNKILRTNAILLAANVLLYSCVFNQFIRSCNSNIDIFYNNNFCNPSAFGSFIAIFFYAHLIVAIFFTVKDTTMKFIILTIFVVGTSSKALVGFSPTVWVSGYRTAILLVISTLILIGYYSSSLFSNFSRQGKDGLNK